MSQSKNTILFDEHKRLNGRIVDFAGWNLPIQYSSVLKEHEVVRTNCGLFDVSHMGELRVTGVDAAQFLETACINSISKITPGNGQYTAILNHDGGFVDDLILYQIAANEFFICMNAANVEKDVAWFKTLARDFQVQVEDLSDGYSQIAVQGPNSRACIEAAFPEWKDSNWSSMKYMQIGKVAVKGANILIARTGYTGEVGYEMYIPNEATKEVWNRLLDARYLSTKAEACGLGCRDTLRLESCYLLYGNDMNDTTTPLEAGIRWATKMNGPSFIGKEKLLNSPAKKKLYAFVMAEPGIPRHGMSVLVNGATSGEVTSGSVLPTVGGAGGFVMLNQVDLKEGDEFEIDIRGSKKKARVAKRPLYQAKVHN
jgi:aminomethyltransferase